MLMSMMPSGRNALTKKRSPHEKACAIILKEKGRKFDPEIIDCFLRIEEKFNRISVELADSSEN